MSMIYTKIDPYNFEVSEAIKLLNANIDYVYNLANNLDKNNTVSTHNIIPYADFSVLSNLSYWKTLDNSKIFFQEGCLKLSSFSNVLSLVSPVFSEKVESFQAYTLVLNTATENEKSLYINKAYILQEDGTQLPLKVYTEVKSKEFSIYSLVFQFETTITNGRLVIISENLPNESLGTFKYEDSLLNTFFSEKGFLRDTIDLDSLDKEISKETFYLIDTIKYSFYTDNNDVLQEIEDNKVKDGDLMIIPSLFISNEDEGTYSITTNLEQFVYTLLKMEKENISSELSIIASYYTQSKIKGAFPITYDSLDYSILSSLYIHKILNKYITENGDIEVKDIKENSIKISQIYTDIEDFIKNNIKDVLSDDFIKGGFTYIPSESGETYSLEWKYLNENNTLSKNTLSVDVMYDLMEKLNSLDINTSKYHKKIIDNFNYTIPDNINVRGEVTGNYKYSIKTLFNIHYYKKASDLEYKNDFINLILEYKQDNKLYKNDYTSINNIYSNSQYLEFTIDNSTVYSDYNIYFKTIAIGKGNTSNISNDNNSNFNSVIEKVKDTKLEVSEDSILAIAEDKFIEKTYFEGELKTIYSKIKEASVTIDIDSIVAKVMESKAFVDLTDEVNKVKASTEENKSSIEVLKDKINLSVDESKFQSYLSQSSNIGSNLVQNSCFLRELEDYTLQGTTGEIITTSQGKVYYHLNTASVTSLRQEIQNNLYTGDYVLGLDVYGSGSLTLNIYNNEDDSVIATKEITPTTSSARYYITFNIKTITKANIEIYIENANIYFSYLKLCRGTEDFGWTLSSEDMNLLANSIREDYEKIVKYYTNDIVDGDISEIINGIESDSNKLISVSNITLTHPILKSTTLLANTSIALSSFTTDTTAFISYLREDNDKTLLNDKASTFYTSFIKLVNNLVFIIDYVANFDVSTNNSAYIDSIKKDINDVNVSMKDLDKNLSESIKDGILTSEEKTKLRNNLTVLEREKAELDVKVQYYTTQDTIKDSEEVQKLSVYASSYNSAYKDIVDLVNSILEKDEVTQDMKYEFNSKYEVYKEQADLLQSQLLKVVSKYSSTQTQLEIKKVETKIEGMSTDLKSLQKLVGDVSSDSILTTLEKRSLQNQLQDITNSYLTIKAEIDYYQAQEVLKDTTEINTLTSLETQLDTQYTQLKTEIDRLLEGDTITEDDTTRVKGYISNITDTLKSVQTSLSDCLLKLSVAKSNPDLDSINTEIDKIQNSLGSLIDFTNEAWKDDLLTYTETITLVNLVNQLELQIQAFLDRVDNLLENEFIKVNEDIKTKLQNAKSSTSEAFNNLKSTIQTISEDGVVKTEEKVLFNNSLSAFYSVLNTLRSVIAEAENIIITGQANKVYEDSKKYVDDNYKDVKDTVDKMSKFADDAWVDGIISKAETVTFTNLLDSLYKESLDMKKQAEVYMSATLTPELQGTTELASLATTLAAYESAYNDFYDAVQEIANFKGVTSKDKTDYEKNKTKYEAALVNLVQDLLNCSKKVSEVKTKNALNFTDKDGKTTTVIDWVKNADIELTKEKIKLYVENTSTVLITSTYLENNYMKTSELENTYASKSEIKALDDKIALTVKSTEMTSYKEEFLNDAKDYTDDKFNQGNNTNTKSLDIYFYLSDSATELVGGTWTTTAPQWVNGKYMWQKVVTTYGNGTTSESTPTCISGAIGPKGDDGTSFRILNSYTSLEELKKAHPTNEIGDAYMVGNDVYTWTGTDFLNLGPIKGADGQNGSDGKTPYVHFKYSNDNGKTFTANAGETPGDYLGTRVDFVKEDSSTPSDYNWVKVKGEPGADGVDGISAKSLTLTVNRYAIAFDSENKVKDNSDITLVVNQQNYEDSIKWETTPTVTLSGTGKTRTLSTSVFSTNTSVVIKVTSGELSDTVTIVKVKDGEQGEQGISITSVDVEYGISDSVIDTPTEWNTDSPTWQEGKFIWSRTKTSYSDTSSSYSDAVCISGADGRSIVSVKEQYYLSASSTSQVGGSWQDTVPTWQQGKYIWTRSVITYSTGSPTTTSPICTTGYHGQDGKDAYTILLSNESHTFAGNESSAIASSITCNIIAYKGGTQVSASIGTITGNPTGMTITLSNNNTVNSAFIVKVDNTMTTKNGTLTIPITVDGKSFTKQFSYSLSLKGQDGINAYTIVLSNEAHTFMSNEEGTIATTTFSDVNVYKGTSIVISQIGSITNIPSGMTVSISNNNSTKPRFTVTVDKTFNTKTGYLSIPVTADGVSFVKQFSFTLVLDGASGVDGKDAKSLILSASKQVVAFNKDNTLKDTTDITLTANQQNFTDAITWTTTPSVTLNGTGNTRTLSPNNFVSNNSIKVTISSGGLSDTVTLVKIKDGTDGNDGKDAKLLSLSANRQVVSYDENNKVKDSTAITLTANQQNFTDTITWSTSPSVTLSGTGKTRTLSTSNFDSNKVIKVTIIAGGLSDTVTIAKVIDGTNGTDGEDAYTVVLTNESHTFAGSETSAIASSTTTQVLGYKGSKQQSVTIGTITGAPTGMSTSIQNNNSANAYVKIDVTTSMTTKNGTLTIPVTIDGHTFNKIFTYSLALKGSDGQSVKSVTEEYALGDSATEHPTTGWSTICPVWQQGKYLWCRLKLVYDNPYKVEYAGYYVDTTWQAINEIKIGGRNLWVIGDLQAGYEVSGAIASSTEQHQCRKTIIDVGDNKYLTYQVWNPNKVTNTTNTNRVAFFDSSNTYIGGSSVTIPNLNGTTHQTLVIDIPSTAKGVRLGSIVGTSSGKDSDMKIKFEFGNQATDYSPAPEDTTTYVDNAIYSLETDLKSQIDNKIQTYNQTNDPSTNWSSTDEKNQHKGDLWYNGTETKRWSGIGWETITDVNLKSLASSKAQIFIKQPTIPYYQGDLWITALDGTGVVKTCKTTRTSGSFTANDWAEGLKYTDNSTVDTKLKDYVLVKTYNTGIETTKKEILGTVSASYATKQNYEDNKTKAEEAVSKADSASSKADNASSKADSAKDSIDKLQVGGRNLVRDSAFKEGSKYWNLGTGCVVDTTTTPYSVKSTQSGKITNTWLGCQSKNLPKVPSTLKGNTVYTASCYYYINSSDVNKLDYGIALEVGGIKKGSSSISIIANQGVSSNYVTNTWARIKVTFTTSAEYTEAYLSAYVYRNGVASFSQFQLEEGTQATAWSQAPEDIENAVTDVKNNLANNYLTTSQIDQKYETKTQVSQDLNRLQVSFTSSGGYNLIKNSSGQGNMLHWKADSSDVAIQSNKNPILFPFIQETESKAVITMETSLITSVYIYSDRFVLSPNTKYTLSGKINVQSGAKVGTVSILISNTVTDLESFNTSYDTKYNAGTSNTASIWQTFNYTFTTSSSVKTAIIRLEHTGSNTTNTKTYVHFADLCLYLGELKMPWSPHPTEIYDGSTIIDKGGVSVYDSKSNFYTNISSTGLDIYQAGQADPVASFKKDGAYISKLTSPLVDCYTIPRYASYYGLASTYYVSDKMSGDGSGKDRNNCSNSIQAILNSIKKRNGNIIDKIVTIYIVNGSNIVEDFMISDFSGSGWLCLYWEYNTTFVGSISVLNNSLTVEYSCENNAMFHGNCDAEEYKKRHKMYMTQKITGTIYVNNSSVFYIHDITAIVPGRTSPLTDSEVGFGYFVYSYVGSNVRIHNCDVVYYKGFVYCSDSARTSCIDNGGYCQNSFSGITGGLIINDGKYPEYSSSKQGNSSSQGYGYLESVAGDSTYYRSRYLALDLSTDLPGGSSTYSWTNGTAYTFTWVDGEYADLDTGAYITSSSDSRTPKLYCEGATSIYVTTTYEWSSIVFYDAVGTMKSGSRVNTSGSFNVPEGISYFIVSMQTSNKGDCTIKPTGLMGNMTHEEEPCFMYYSTSYNYEVSSADVISSSVRYTGNPSIGNPRNNLYRYFDVILDYNNEFDRYILQTLATKTISKIQVKLTRISSGVNDSTAIDIKVLSGNYSQVVDSNLAVGNSVMITLNSSLVSDYVAKAKNVYNNTHTYSYLRIESPNDLGTSSNVTNQYAEFDSKSTAIYVYYN